MFAPGASVATASISSAESPAQRAIGASVAALVVAVAAGMTFLPPMVQSTIASVPRTVAAALVLATAVLLHWVFLGIAARRLERSVPGWLAMGVLLFPIGGAAALILFGWFEEDRQGPRRVPAPAPSPFG
jgi:hypothetical protein